MMLGSGRHGSARILSRPAVETMTSDHLTDAQKAAFGLVPGYFDSNGWGFGLCRGDAAHRPRDHARPIWLGRRAGYLVVRGPAGGRARHPDDPARLDLSDAAAGVPRFLDSGLPGDRRLTKPDRTIHPASKET
jgi:hypothetical protein